MKFTNLTVTIFAATFVTTLGILAYVSMGGGDVDMLVYFIGVVLGAAFPGLLNGKRLGNVEKNTNGALSSLMKERDEAIERATILETQTQENPEKPGGMKWSGK